MGRTKNDGMLVDVMAETDGRYRLIWTLIAHLPRNGRWTAKERTAWIHAMTCAVDLLVEVTNERTSIRARAS